MRPGMTASLWSRAPGFCGVAYCRVERLDCGDQYLLPTTIQNSTLGYKASDIGNLTACECKLVGVEALSSHLLYAARLVVCSILCWAVCPKRTMTGVLCVAGTAAGYAGMSLASVTRTRHSALRERMNRGGQNFA